MARSFMDEQAKIANAPTAAAEAATKTLTEKGKEFLSRMSAGAGKKVDTALDYAKRNKAGLAVGAGTTAGGYMIGKGVGRYKQKKKMLAEMDEEKNSSIEAAALEMARQALADNGIDPDTGKVASEEDQVRIRALEILKEAGWVE
jgi:hypothetical protein